MCHWNLCSQSLQEDMYIKFLTRALGTLINISTHNLKHNFHQITIVRLLLNDFPCLKMFRILQLRKFFYSSHVINCFQGKQWDFTITKYLKLSSPSLSVLCSTYKAFPTFLLYQIIQLAQIPGLKYHLLKNFTTLTVAAASPTVYKVNQQKNLEENPIFQNNYMQNFNESLKKRIRSPK